jgi:hypothetical protein
MMQNTSATDPRGISLEAEIRSTQSRLDTTSDIGSRSSAPPHAPSAGCSDRTDARADANSLAGSKPRRWRRSPHLRDFVQRRKMAQIRF